MRGDAITPLSIQAVGELPRAFSCAEGFLPTPCSCLADPQMLQMPELPAVCTVQPPTARCCLTGAFFYFTSYIQETHFIF